MGTWLVSSEPWWFAPEAVSLFTLRASQGSTGQRPSFAAQYETFTIGQGGTLNPAFIGNKNLKPEINTETEVGTDLEIMGRYGVNISYSQAVVDGQILPVQPSTVTRLCDRLVARGLATRQHGQTDRRVVWVRLSRGAASASAPEAARSQSTR